MTVLISLSPEELIELKDFLYAELDASEFMEDSCPSPEGKTFYNTRIINLRRLLGKL